VESARYIENQEGYSTLTDPFHWRNMSRPPTDLTPHLDRLVSIQDEFRSHFGWDESDDLSSARNLISEIEQSGVEEWKRPNRAATVANIQRRLVLREQNVAILGAAIDLEELTTALDSPTLLIAADGAAGAISLLPETTAERAWSRLAFIVTDADGGDGTIEAVKRGKTAFLHAHGDNESDWIKLLKVAKNATTPPPLVLTHQTSREIPGMHNPGGFTDGDRAACIAMSLGVPIERIRMLGTNTREVGRWSGVTEKKRKLVKLQWMGMILQTLGIEY
tara:strand:- start:1372 stop:2202 length:831 start_codon:yes stop_codon:yes gene_type:complete